MMKIYKCKSKIFKIWKYTRVSLYMAQFSNSLWSFGLINIQRVIGCTERSALCAPGRRFAVLYLVRLWQFLP